MKLPALWIAAAFVVGIELSRHAQISVLQAAFVAGVAMALTAGLLWRKHAPLAWIAVLLAWSATGATAVAVQRSSVSPKSISALVAQGRLDTSSPLRWRGRLRSDPAKRRWGTEYLIDLESVQISVADLPVRGGLRLTLYGDLPSPSNSPICVQVTASKSS